MGQPERQILLPWAKRSRYGAFEPTHELTVLDGLVKDIKEGTLKTRVLDEQYGLTVKDRDKLNLARQTLQRLQDGLPRKGDLATLIHILYVAHDYHTLRRYNFLFPAYRFDEDFESNTAAGTMGTRIPQLQSRPEIPSQRWRFLGRDIGFPIGVGPSPLTDNAESIAALSDLGYNIFTYRTVRSRHSRVTDPPNWAFITNSNLKWRGPGRRPRQVRAGIDLWIEPGSERVSMANFFGLPSRPDRWEQELGQAIQALRSDQVLITSILGEHKTSPSQDALVLDFLETASKAHGAGAEVLELNLSSPNTLYRGGIRDLLCEDWELSLRIVEAVRAKFEDQVKIIVKLADMQLDMLQKVVQETAALVDAYCAINAVPATVLQPKGKDSFFPTRSGAVSGFAIRNLALRAVQALAQERLSLGSKFQIIGIGGVTSPTSFQNLYNAGASVVQSVTGVVANPLLAYDCISELGPDLPLSAPSVPPAQTEQLQESIYAILQARPGLSQYAVADLLPIQMNEVFDLLDAMVDSKRIVPVNGSTSSAWTVDTVCYRADLAA